MSDLDETVAGVGILRQKHTGSEGKKVKRLVRPSGLIQIALGAIFTPSGRLRRPKRSRVLSNKVLSTNRSAIPSRNMTAQISS